MTQHQARRLYVFRWNRLDRKDELCYVTARGAMNSCRVEFFDGFKIITSRNAIRLVRPSDFSPHKGSDGRSSDF